MVSDQRTYFPSALNVAGRDCWVIGNDQEAIWKAGRLLDAGARVTWIAAQLDPAVINKFSTRLRLEIREFRIEDLTDQYFVILSAKDNPVLAEKVWERCRERRILLCAVDLPQFCDVVNVSYFQKGHLKVMVSTDGTAPGVSRKIREGLEASFRDVPVDLFLEDLAALRRDLEKTVLDAGERRKRLLGAVEGFEFRSETKFPATWEPSSSQTKKKSL